MHLYLWYNVTLWRRCWLSTHEYSVVRMTVLAAALQQLLKCTQPASNQVNVLQEIKSFLSTMR